MTFLSSYYNMTIHHFEIPHIPSKFENGTEKPRGPPIVRSYMLEINPNWVNGSRADRLNVIDARWVDMQSGYFIDITTVRPSDTHPVKGMLGCKDGHEYLEKSIFPLRETVFEGQLAHVPYAYVGIIIAEYGKKALTRVQLEE
jgi:hypothetical protein